MENQTNNESNLTTPISSQENIEQIKQEQNKKMENLKSLLIKAKSTIQKLKQENSSLEKSVDEFKTKNEQMEKLIKKYLDNQEDENNSGGTSSNNIVKKYKNQNAKIEEVQAKIVLNGINWVCIRFDNYCIEWVREEHLDLNDQKEIKDNQQQQSNSNVIDMPTCIDYNRFAEKEQEQEKKSKNFDNDLKNVINQYEERIKRMHENQSTLEEKIAVLEQQVNQEKSQNQENSISLKEVCSQIVSDSEQIRENCLQIMSATESPEEENEKSQQIKFLLIKLQKMNILQENGLEFINDLKDHVLILQQTLFDILKRNKIEKEENQEDILKYQKQIQKYQQTLKHEKQEKKEILDEGRKRIKELDQKYEKLKSQTILEQKEKDVKIDFLNKELKKNVNNMYLKNILIKFFLAGDNKEVQKKMIAGIQTVLQFTEDEVTDVNKALFENNQNTGIIGSLFGFGGK